jgi:hypothetical protein
MLRQLGDQKNFIEASCKLFDKGKIGEGKRIATAIRILVHDTKNSCSLLTQLGYKTRLKFVSRAVPNTTSNTGPYHGLLNITLPAMRYRPKLDGVAGRSMSFDDWWSEPVLKDTDGTLYSRKKLVLFVADTDGGAHVDPEMDDAYAKLSQENHVGYRVAIGGRQILWDENPVLPSLRQIGYEVLESLNLTPMVETK